MKKFTLLIVFISLCAANMKAYDFAQETKEGQFRTTLYYAINPDGESVTIVTGPEKYAFEAIVIPETVTHNGKTYTVTTIGSSAFSSCNIGAVEMPNTITEIMSQAFASSSVDSVKFSKGLKHIRDDAFNNTGYLTRIELPEGLETIGKRAFFEDNSYIAGGLYYIYIPNSVYEIGESALAYQRHLNWVHLPEGLKEIKDGTFYHCLSLEHITLPKELEAIGNNAFQSCKLREILFPEKVKKIGENAFDGNLLQTVVIPDNVELLGKSTFSSCTNLTSIKFSKGMKTVPEYVCVGCKELIDVNIPENIENIGLLAFSNCTLLSNVKFPESVKNIGFGVFMNSGLTRFTFPSQITEIPQQFFQDCTNLAEYTIQEHITSVGISAFSGCNNLRTIKLHNGITALGAGAFYQCRALEEIELPNSITKIGEMAFQDCEMLQTVKLPTNLKVIEDYTFRGCSNIKSIIFPDSLTTIKQMAFESCSSLEEITPPKGIKEIYNSVFSGCSLLRKVTIPHTVKIIDYWAFANCPSLAEVHINCAIPPRGPSNGLSIFNADNNCTLYVPLGAKATYEAAWPWNTFYEIVEEDVPDVYYSIEGRIKKGSGAVTVNGLSITSAKEVLAKEEVAVLFTAKEGYVIEKILCNNEEIGHKWYDTTEFEYRIESLETNYVFEVYYKEAPVILNIKSGNGGAFGVKVEKGSAFTCNITTDEGWHISCLMFNGNDVTNEINSNNEYTTPNITNESTLSVTFETASSSRSIAANHIKVYTTNNNSIIIDGAEDSGTIRIYHENGTVAKEITNAGNHEIIVTTSGIYIVEINNRVFKIAV